MDVNGWLILYFTSFQERLNDLEQTVLRIQKKQSEQFAKHPTVKLLKAVVQAILVEVPTNCLCLVERYSSLRQDGAKTDVYRVFKRLLDQGKVPDSWDQLVAASAPPRPSA